MRDNDLAANVQRLRARGNLQKVEALCRATLKKDPDHPVARRELGLLNLAHGRFDEANDLLGPVLAAAPHDADLHLAVGHAALSAGESETAADFFLKALALSPESVDAHYHLGIAAQQLGKLEDAALCYDTSLRLQPAFPEAHNNLGAILERQGQSRRAEEHYRHALEQQPGLRSAGENLVRVLLAADDFVQAAGVLVTLAKHHSADKTLPLRSLAAATLGGEPHAAARLLAQAVTLLPDNTGGPPLGKMELREGELLLLARALQQAVDTAPGGVTTDLLWRLSLLWRFLGNPPEHERCLRQLVGHEHPLALRELGDIHFKRREFEKANEYYQRALLLLPDDPDALNGAAAYLMVGRSPPQIGAAIPLFERAVRRAPQHAGAMLNLGLAYFRYGDPRAVQTLQQAVALAPQSADAHNNLALAFLAQGDLGKGWREHEWRLRTPAHRQRPFPWRQWQGESLAGKTILAHAEQGLGDEILFASCLPDLTAMVGHVIIECDPRLGPLFTRSFPSASVRPRVRYDALPNLDGLPVPDFHIALGSLPLHFRHTLDDFPGMGFLKADPNRIAYWRRRLDALGPGRKIGFSWRSGLVTFGRPVYPSLVEWHSLFEYTEGCHFIDLQYDDTSTERAELEETIGHRLVHFDGVDLRNELDELGALLSALDLVITCGNVNAPFAGALGAPTWRLFSTRENDAMRLGASNYPWFRSMTLLEQRKPSEPQLLRLLGGWLRGFRAFTAPNGPREIAARGFISLALHDLQAQQADVTSAPLALFLRDLCCPEEPLPQALVENAGSLGALISAHRQSEPAPPDSPRTDDTLYYRLTSPDAGDLCLAQFAERLAEGAPIPEGFAALRPLYLRSFYADNLDLARRAATLLLANTTQDMPTINFLAVLGYWQGDLPFALLHESARAGRQPWTTEWMGEPFSEVELIVDAVDPTFFALRFICVFNSLEAVANATVTVVVAPELEPLLSRTYPQLRVLTTRDVSRISQRPQRWTTIESLARFFGIQFDDLVPITPEPGGVRELRDVLQRTDGPYTAIYRVEKISPVTALLSDTELAGQIFALDGLANSDKLMIGDYPVPAAPPDSEPDTWAKLFASFDRLVTDCPTAALLGAAVGTPSILVVAPAATLPARLFPFKGKRCWFPTLAYARTSEQFNAALDALRPFRGSYDT